MQVKPDTFEDVLAQSMLFHRSGVLAFFANDACHPDDLILAYAPDQWITVHREKE